MPECHIVMGQGRRVPPGWGEYYIGEVLDTIVAKVTYRHTKELDTLNIGSRAVEDRMTLLLGSRVSSFYSEFRLQADTISRQQYNSLFSSYRDGLITRNQLPSAKTTNDYIYRNYPKYEVTTVYTTLLVDEVQYEEKTEYPNWQFADSTRVIQGYECHLAYADFRGRRWHAWYAPDIATAEGPWKLIGLPGLILEAYDEGRHYVYECAGLEFNLYQPLYYFLANSDRPYQKMDRLEYLQQMAKLYFKGGAEVVIEASAGLGHSGGNRPISRYDFQERDYN